MYKFGSELNRRRLILEKRLDNIHRRCEEFKNDGWKNPYWPAMFANREKGVVLCAVAKVACTTWKRILLRLTGNPAAIKLANVVTLTDRMNLHARVSQYLGCFSQMNSETRTEYLTGDYYKIMFVREPMERLISGYRDKMFRDPHNVYLRLRVEVKRLLRPNISRSSQEFKKNVTFSEFVRFVLWTAENKHHIDNHWLPHYDFCRPCHIDYDYIGYYETMHNDAKDVLRKVADGSNITFPETDNIKLINSREYFKLFEDVSVADIRRILALYEKDYKVFGYEVPDVIRRRLDDDDVRDSADVFTQRKSYRSNT